MSETVNNLEEFIKARRCSEKSFDDIRRNTYKYTNCGAWIDKTWTGKVEGEDHVDMFGCEHEAEVLWAGITVGSIVEGADYDCQSITLKYPFKIDEFWTALQSVEDEADLIWKRENEDHEMPTL